MKNDITPHWKDSVHTPDKWELVGRITTPTQELDVYIHKNKEQYRGVSIQYGPEHSEYYSCEYPYVDDATVYMMQGLINAFAFEHGREYYRHERNQPAGWKK